MSTGTSAPRPQRRWRRRRLIVACGVLLVFSLIVAHTKRREDRRQWLISEVHTGRGTAVGDEPLWDRLEEWYYTGSFPDQPTVVLLADDKFDDVWIRDHDDLRGLQIVMLESHYITGSDLASLIDEHPLEVLDLTGSLLSEDAVAAIRRKTKLKSLTLSHSNLDDASLAALPLEQLELLHVTASGVTATGLTELSRCQTLESVALGADQLTAETAQVLASLGTVRQIWLAGIEITDTQLEHLQQVSTLKQVHLFQTRTTAPGRAALAAVLPACAIENRNH